MVATAFVIGAGDLAAGSADGSPSYTLFGSGDVPVRTGVLAGEAKIEQAPGVLAVRPDGVIAFATLADGKAFWVEHGRLTRVRLPATGELALGLSFATDGTLLASTCDELSTGRPRVPSAVWRVAPGRPPQRFAGRPGRRGSSGDGGLATAARLNCPIALDTQPDGGVLIVDGSANRIRRVGPDGVIQTVAGSGRDASDGDGGPAVLAGVLPIDVAALPAGGFAFTDLGPDSRDPAGVRTVGKSVVRVVDDRGIITTRSRVRALAVGAEASGALLTADSSGDSGVISRLEADGRLAAVTDLRREMIGIPRGLPIAGDPFGSDLLEPYDVAALPDGGVLFAGAFADATVNYVPPPKPSLLAVAILPATRRPARDLRLAVRTTLPARVHVGVWARGHRAASATALVAGGDASVPISRRLRPGLYSVRVRAEGAGQVAAARADVLVGGRLPVPFVRRFIDSRQELFRVFNNAARAKLECRRIASRRVDCGIVQRRRCTAVATVRVQPDGTLAVAQYDGGHRRRCRLRR